MSVAPGGVISHGVEFCGANGVERNVGRMRCRRWCNVSDAKVWRTKKNVITLVDYVRVTYFAPFISFLNLFPVRLKKNIFSNRSLFTVSRGKTNVRGHSKRRIWKCHRFHDQPLSYILFFFCKLLYTLLLNFVLIIIFVIVNVCVVIAMNNCGKKWSIVKTQRWKSESPTHLYLVIWHCVIFLMRLHHVKSLPEQMKKNWRVLNRQMYDRAIVNLMNRIDACRAIL